MVKIRRVKEEPCYLHKDGKYVGEILNFREYWDVIIQIAREDVSGYSIYYKNKMSDITKDGTVRIDEHPFTDYDREKELYNNINSKKRK